MTELRSVPKVQYSVYNQKPTSNAKGWACWSFLILMLLTGEKNPGFIKQDFWQSLRKSAGFTSRLIVPKDRGFDLHPS